VPHNKVKICEGAEFTRSKWSILSVFLMPRGYEATFAYSP